MSRLLRKVMEFLATTNLPIPGKDALLARIREVYEAREKAIRAINAFRRLKGQNHPAVDTFLDAEQELQDLVNTEGVEGLGVPWAVIGAAGGIAAVAVALAVGAWKLSGVRDKYYQVVQEILNDPSLSSSEKQALISAVESGGVDLGFSIPLWIPLILAAGVLMFNKRR